MTKKQKRKKGIKTKSAGRFGARYGRRIRKAITEIEGRTRAAHTCPKCERKSVKRIGTGIWKCAKCSYTFTGGTYIPHTPLGITAERIIKRIIERGGGDGGVEVSTDVGISIGRGIGKSSEKEAEAKGAGTGAGAVKVGGE